MGEMLKFRATGAVQQAVHGQARTDTDPPSPGGFGGQAPSMGEEKNAAAGGFVVEVWDGVQMVERARCVGMGEALLEAGRQARACGVAAGVVRYGQCSWIVPVADPVAGLTRRGWWAHVLDWFGRGPRAARLRRIRAAAGPVVRVFDSE